MSLRRPCTRQRVGLREEEGEREGDEARGEDPHALDRLDPFQLIVEAEKRREDEREHHVAKDLARQHRLHNRASPLPPEPAAVRVELGHDRAAHLRRERLVDDQLQLGVCAPLPAPQVATIEGYRGR
eukprot:6213321-Pleurochrysis_carterae.AAC.1